MEVTCRRAGGGATTGRGRDESGQAVLRDRLTIWTTRSGSATHGSRLEGRGRAIRTATACARSRPGVRGGPVAAADGSSLHRIDARLHHPVFPFLNGVSYPCGPRYTDGGIKDTRWT